MVKDSRLYSSEIVSKVRLNAAKMEQYRDGRVFNEIELVLGFHPMCTGWRLFSVWMKRDRMIFSPEHLRLLGRLPWILLPCSKQNPNFSKPFKGYSV